MRRSVLAAMLMAMLLMVSLTVLAQSRRSERVEKVKDPVCGLMVDKSPALSANHKGQSYYFCSKADMEAFKKTPDRYVKSD